MIRKMARDQGDDRCPTMFYFQAAQLIADARVACLKLAIRPEKIAKIMMDEAILALMAERFSLSDIQATFKKYAKRDLPRFYICLLYTSPSPRDRTRSRMPSSA